MVVCVISSMSTRVTDESVNTAVKNVSLLRKLHYKCLEFHAIRRELHFINTLNMVIVRIVRVL